MAATAIRLPLVRLRAGRLDDGRLAALAATGDERAFEVIYDRHHRALLGFCRHMLGSQDEAEDALQQTFLRAHRALVSQGAPDELRPWLFTIARNRCLTMLAARKAAAGRSRRSSRRPRASARGGAARRPARTARRHRAPARRPALRARARGARRPLARGDRGRDQVPTSKVKALVHQARTRLIADRDARETPCEDVREQLATARGGELRRGPLRRHLALCEACSAYRDAVAEQRPSSPRPAGAAERQAQGHDPRRPGRRRRRRRGHRGRARGGAAPRGAASPPASPRPRSKARHRCRTGRGAGGGAVAVERTVTSPRAPRRVLQGAHERRGRGGRQHERPTVPTARLRPPCSRARAPTGRARPAASVARRLPSAAASAHRSAVPPSASANGPASKPRKDRAADKDARAVIREQRKQDLATARQQQTAARQERLAAGPDRGSSGYLQSCPRAPRTALRPPPRNPRAAAARPSLRGRFPPRSRRSTPS